jgi:hypothetical protein
MMLMWGGGVGGKKTFEQKQNEHFMECLTANDRRSVPTPRHVFLVAVQERGEKCEVAWK